MSKSSGLLDKFSGIEEAIDPKVNRYVICMDGKVFDPDFSIRNQKKASAAARVWIRQFKLDESELQSDGSSLVLHIPSDMYKFSKILSIAQSFVNEFGDKVSTKWAMIKDEICTVELRDNEDQPIKTIKQYYKKDIKK